MTMPTLRLHGQDLPLPEPSIIDHLILPTCLLPFLYCTYLAATDCTHFAALVLC
ncbi:hypothetical protein BDW02DRAFT_564824 [Decorospora gaudefroyi]|uniref:Uncharacterized protein n=1 Tax=Decorospora gaudefroyi TaxID=184978 RepID=A0A6A5KTV8_9PLEO|nr:hypothetical protein BDW02DRAFT_564824 [Decorospora gaudefroyi]